MAENTSQDEDRAIDELCDFAMRTAREITRDCAEKRAAAAAAASPAPQPPEAACSDAHAPQANRTHVARQDLPEPAADANPQSHQPAPTAAPRKRRGIEWPESIKQLYRDDAPPDALSPRQVMAARLLLAGHRVSHVADQLGINRHTISGWLKSGAFHREVRRMAIELPIPPQAAGALHDWTEDEEAP